MSIHDLSTGLLVMSSRTDDELVIHLVGELDMASWPRLVPLMDEPLNDDSVVFDLSGLTLLASAGIAALLEVAQRWPDFRLRNPHRLILPIVRAAGLDRNVELT